MWQTNDDRSGRSFWCPQRCWPSQRRRGNHTKPTTTATATAATIHTAIPSTATKTVAIAATAATTPVTGTTTAVDDDAPRFEHGVRHVGHGERSGREKTAPAHGWRPNRLWQTRRRHPTTGRVGWRRLRYFLCSHMNSVAVIAPYFIIKLCFMSIKESMNTFFRLVSCSYCAIIIIFILPN